MLCTKRAGRAVLLGIGVAIFSFPSLAAMAVTLNSSVSRASLATLIDFDAQVQGADAANLWYRYRVRRMGGEFQTIHDFGPKPGIEWTNADVEGAYEVEVTVRDRETGETATAARLISMMPLAGRSGPVVTGTAHPLLFLYSAPPCPEGASMRVRFESPEGVVQSTPDKACRPGLTMNFYLAGLRGETEYRVRHTLNAGERSMEGPELAFITRPSLDFMQRSVLQTPPDGARSGIILESPLSAPMMATDLFGHVVWYYGHDISFVTRPDVNGRFFGIVQSPGDHSLQEVREFDLAGVTQRETNAARINEQLTAMGRRPISGFHHEALRLPDGRILVLASSEEILTDVQGPGPVNVLSDAIIVMDSNLQVVWAWDGFDHLDVRRAAIFDQKCSTGACPKLFLDTDANDWLHGNSVQPTPDGNLIFSIRHQDWVVKIDYRNGSGDGSVLWRLGKDGDFTYLSSDPFPWFSHQHDARFIDANTIIVFDNGNTRRAVYPDANSRGQVIRLDEEKRTATFVMNADLGAYAYALGSAQKLLNDNYHFEMGWVPSGGSISVEIDPEGGEVYSLKASLPRYRTFRMQDMYTPY